MRDVFIGRTYRHFKGHFVSVIDIAYHSETLEEMVVYRYNNKTWVRPKKMFLSKVDREKYPNVIQKYRFELVSDIINS